ncbi:MAG TPA: hypothetical protein DIT07_13995 [Sphingobacteriaceae bacterium]|nr:hypothetical protein [Sphingobacteriaceae bacterium]
METNPLFETLSKLSEQLSKFDKRVGAYCGYTSTGKGITLQTNGCNLFLYPAFIYKFMYHPEQVTEEDLTEVVDFARFEQAF